MRTVPMTHAQMAVSLDNHWRSLSGLIHDANRFGASADVLAALEQARKAVTLASELLLTVPDA